MSLQHLFEGDPRWVGPTIAVGLALVLAYLVADLVARLLRIPLARVLDATDRDGGTAILRPVRITRLVVFLVLAAIFVFPALQLVGFRTAVGLQPEVLSAWLLRSGLRVAVIALLAYAVIRIVATSTRRFEHEAARSGGVTGAERAKRIQTLGTLITNTVAVVITGAALMMILRELNIDIVPLLTGAGIVGLAIGFGAQTLVKDVISGFFLILENQVRVGDVAVINGTGGLVEGITLRTIVLRDLQGVVHVFPNGSVNTLANMTKDFSYFVLDVAVSYREDPDRAMQTLREVGADLQADAVFGASILEPLEVLGVEAFSDSAVTIRARVKTLPLKQWEVGRELRRRVKRAFDERGIEIPFPQRTLHLASVPPEWAAAAATPLEARQRDSEPARR